MFTINVYLLFFLFSVDIIILGPYIKLRYFNGLSLKIIVQPFHYFLLKHLFTQFTVQKDSLIKDTDDDYR